MSMQPSGLPAQDPGLNITEAAIDHLKRALEKSDASPLGVRVGVKKAGCSGYEYTVAFALSPANELDYVFQFDDLSIFIDKEIYVKFLKGGTTMDYRVEGLKSGLQFDNPNVAAQCGCGESFTLK